MRFHRVELAPEGERSSWRRRVLREIARVRHHLLVSGQMTQEDGVGGPVGRSASSVAPDVTPTIYATAAATVAIAVSGPVVRPLPVPSSIVRRIVSAGERIAACVGLVLGLPLLVVLGLVLRVSSGGPVLFRQPRCGRGGQVFTILKLRTMVTDAETQLDSIVEDNERDGLVFKIGDDPRMTRLGRWLRRTSLDELPQLWNVAKGDMSLVGPRPPLPREVARYGPEVHVRLQVRPGITGLAQVSGRADLDWAETLRLDQEYVENWSVRMELWILLRTVPAVISRRGAC